MFATSLRQLRFAWSMTSGRPFRLKGLVGLVADLRTTVAEFGTLGQGATAVFAEPDPQIAREMAERHVARAIRQAVRGTNYYGLRFTQREFMSKEITLESLAEIEPTSATVFKQHPEAFVWENAKPELLAYTSGTTGVPTPIWFSRYELEVMAASQAMGLIVNGLRPEHVFVMCARSQSISQMIYERAVGMAGAAYAMVRAIDPDAMLDRLTTSLHMTGKMSKVTHMIASPAYLGLLVQCAERRGFNSHDFGLTAVHVGGDLLTDALRERAEEIFGAAVVEGYTATEIMPIGGEVCEQQHLHIPTTQGYVEVLDPTTGQLATPGMLGVLTVTPYPHYRDTTRLLRYSTGDLVRVLPAGPPLTCRLAEIPATSRVLDRMPSLQRDLQLTARDIVDLLQSERGLPLPTRYCVDNGDPIKPVLHVVAEKANRRLLARLEQAAADRGLPIDGIILVDREDDLHTKPGTPPKDVATPPAGPVLAEA
jgi:phenylacetate-CoA ligase